MGSAAIRHRYREFIRRTGRAEVPETVREFLHLEILRTVSVQHQTQLILHGGCKTRYIDGSPRYSLDMDFSLDGLLEADRPEREALVHRTIAPILRELEHLGIPLDCTGERWHRGDRGIKLRFKAYRLKATFPLVFADHPGDLNFNIDIDALFPGEQVRVAVPIADPSLQLLVLADATHMARKAAAVLLRNQLRDLYDLDLYIRRDVRYDLAIARQRLDSPNLSHEELVSQLCKRVEALDLQSRGHQLHLPSRAERDAFLVTAERIAMIRRMEPEA